MRASSSISAPVIMRCEGFSIRGSLPKPELIDLPNEAARQLAGKSDSSRGACAVLLRRSAQLLQRGAQQVFKSFLRAVFFGALDGLFGSALFVAEIEQRRHNIARRARGRNRLARVIGTFHRRQLVAQLDNDALGGL